MKCLACHGLVTSGGNLHRGALRILAGEDPRKVVGGCNMPPHPDTARERRREKKLAARRAQEMAAFVPSRGAAVAGTGKPSASSKAAKK